MKPLLTPRLLLVDDEEPLREMMSRQLEKKGFEVVTAGSVIAALRLIATEKYDVLLTDLHMPNPGDGFTVISAMRHTQPDALRLLVSAFPDVQSAMATIILEADDIIVKPFDAANFASLVLEKMLSRKPCDRSSKERVAVILLRSVNDIIEGWLRRSKRIDDLRNLPLTDDERTGHLPKLVKDLSLRLSRSNSTITGSEACNSASASVHGSLRYLQGYTPAMLVQESRILQVTIFDTLQNNRDCLNFSVLLPDVMTIADEVDSQLTQAMTAFMASSQSPAVA